MEKPTFESKESKEKISKIALRFFRHSIKAREEQDGDIYLSEEGRRLAAEQARDLDNPGLAKAWGSSRIRTGETASLIMDGDLNKDIELAQEDVNMLGVSRVEADNEDRLNFINDVDTETGKAANDAYLAGRYLSYVVNDSDRMVMENGDAGKNSSYSTQAANIASIVKTYLENGSDRWHEIYSKDQEGEDQRSYPKDYAPKLERFLGSHQGVTESFLAKVIEKTEGIEERDAFVEALGGRGFSETEGFVIDIDNDGIDKTIKVQYEKKNDEGEIVYSFSHDIPGEILEEMIAEGDLMEG